MFACFLLVARNAQRQSADIKDSTSSLCRTELTGVKSDSRVSEKVSTTGGII